MIKISRHLLVGVMLCVGSVSAYAQQDNAEIFLRLDRMDNENRRLNGQVEEMRFQIRRMEDQIRRFQLDADARLRDLENTRGASSSGHSAGAALAAPKHPPSTIGNIVEGNAAPPFNPNTPPRRQENRQESGDAPPPPVIRSTSIPPPVNEGNVPTSQTPAYTNGIAVDGINPASLANKTPNDAKQSFDQAKALFDQNNNDGADEAFHHFLKTYPKDKRVAEATFYLGETLSKRSRYREAAEQFLAVTTKHSDSPRAAEAMMKLGMSLRLLGAQPEACGTLDQVNKKYPNASKTVKEAVEREKTRAKCGA